MMSSRVSRDDGPRPHGFAIAQTPMILFSHPTGNANVRETAHALNEAGLLAEFWTSVCWPPEHWLDRLLPRWLARELARRAFPQVRRDQLHCYPWIELGRLAMRELNLSRVLRHEVKRFSIDAVYRSLDSRVAAKLNHAPGIQGVYAYEDGALASFRTAKQLGLKTIYELPIGYWKCYRELMQEEAALQPEWAATMQGSGDSAEKRERKDEELALASDIVVASDYVRGTLQKAGRLAAQISVLPYGAPPAGPIIQAQNSVRNGKLKVLFVGGLSQRKGLSYLLQAVTRLGSKIELTLVGRRVAECRALDAALLVHRWIPSMSHGAVLEEMRRHDVLVFPSLFEGFGLVLLEAMSQGVPAITTPNTAGPEFIRDGEDGFIVPIRDAEAIVEKLEMLLLDRGRLAAMSHAARLKAAQHSWEKYRRRLAATVRQALLKEPAEPSAMPLPQLPECAPC
jgi:alpha-maltose-1-phosphate synthase